jgi:hypothetical protein
MIFVETVFSELNGHCTVCENIPRVSNATHDILERVVREGLANEPTLTRDQYFVLSFGIATKDTNNIVEKSRRWEFHVTESEGIV